MRHQAGYHACNAREQSLFDQTDPTAEAAADARADADVKAGRLIEVADGLAEFSERGRDVGDGRREMTTVWPYVLRYRVEDNRVIGMGRELLID